MLGKFLLMEFQKPKNVIIYIIFKINIFVSILETKRFIINYFFLFLKKCWHAVNLVKKHNRVTSQRCLFLIIN